MTDKKDGSLPVRSNDWLSVFWCFSLFFRILWREWEPKSCGIPEPYRINHRVSLQEAWWIASRIYLYRCALPENAKGGTI